MDSARLGGSRRAASSAFIPVKTGIQEALLKTVLPRQGECGRYQPVIAAPTELVPAEGGTGGPQSGERALETVCLFMLDARSTRRFPLMLLAWIPACARMTWVEGR